MQKTQTKPAAPSLPPLITPKIPPMVGKIQVNFCKSPQCANFGVPAKNGPLFEGKYLPKEDTYDLYTTGYKRDGGSIQTLKCKLCGEFPTVKSNLGIYEELSRFMAPFQPRIVSCPDHGCENHTVPVGTPGAYRKHGTSKLGKPRYRCNGCGITFTEQPPDVSVEHHNEAELNAEVFSRLVNTTPLRRILKVLKIAPPVLYDTIDFIHERCVAFAVAQESRLFRMRLPRLYLASDRQEYMINWRRRKDKRNVSLWSVGTADLRSGFVFGLHVNFDPDMDPEETENDALAIRDYELRDPYRRYARVWLESDHKDAVKSYRAPKKPRAVTKQDKLLQKAINEVYDAAQLRLDIEAPEVVTDFVQLPGKGMQVHSEYTLYAHFFFLRKLLSRMEKLHFYLDQDSGMRAACLAAFADRIKDHRCDAFYVKINKKLTVDQRAKLLMTNKFVFEMEKKRNPNMKEYYVRLMMMKRNMQHPKRHGKWKDRWVRHPFPNMGEPEKAMSYLTDIHDYDKDHLARIYSHASLHAIDRFFMQVRRSVRALERPISTPSNVNRRWYGYNPYDPAMVAKLLDIYRVYYNFVEATRREKKKTKEERKQYRDDVKAGKIQKKPPKPLKTPAMRLGLMDRIVAIEEILNFY